MSDHDDLLAQAERNARRLRRLAAANQEDFLKHSPEFEGEDLRGVAAPELDGADTLDDLAAALRSVEADRDHWKANHADKVHKSRETARLLRETRAELAALQQVVRRFGPPPGTLLLPQDQADALRNAFKKETPVKDTVTALADQGDRLIKDVLEEGDMLAGIPGSADAIDRLANRAWSVGHRLIKASDGLLGHAAERRSKDADQ